MDKAKKNNLLRYINSNKDQSNINHNAETNGRKKLETCDVKAAILNKYKQITGDYPIVDDYKPRIDNIIKTFGSGIFSPEQIIDFKDTSISSNGKSGILITTNAICVCDSANSTSKFIARFEDIDFTYLKAERFLGLDISAIEIYMKDGREYKLSITLDLLDLSEMQQLIDYVIEHYK